MIEDAVLDALDALEVSELTEAQLDRVYAIAERLVRHCEQEFADRDE